MAKTNRAAKSGMQVTWLTPLQIVRTLGRFDLDPCCPPVMPWRTAKRMLCLPPPGGHYYHGGSCSPEAGHGFGCSCTEPGDGLAYQWHGFVFWNPPYDDPLPWVQKAAGYRATALDLGEWSHADDKGFMGGDSVGLLPAKSPETKWGALLLKTAGLLYYPEGRFTFCTPDGLPTKGAFNPHVFAGYGPRGEEAVRRLRRDYFKGGGTLLRRAE